MYAKGAVLPFSHEDEDYINKQIKMTTPSIVKIAQDLEQYIRVELLGKHSYLLFLFQSYQLTFFSTKRSCVRF